MSLNPQAQNRHVNTICNKGLVTQAISQVVIPTQTFSLLEHHHFIIVMIGWTGLAPWELEFPFPGSLTSTVLRLLEPHPGYLLHPKS